MSSEILVTTELATLPMKLMKNAMNNYSQKVVRELDRYKYLRREITRVIVVTLVSVVVIFAIFNSIQ